MCLRVHHVCDCVYMLCVTCMCACVCVTCVCVHILCDTCGCVGVYVRAVRVQFPSRLMADTQRMGGPHHQRGSRKAQRTTTRPLGDSVLRGGLPSRIGCPPLQAPLAHTRCRGVVTQVTTEAGLEGGGCKAVTYTPDQDYTGPAGLKPGLAGGNRG